jgi:hypothetical protein
VQDQIHLSEKIRKRLGFTAEDTLRLKGMTVLDRLALFLQVLERFDEKPAGAASQVEDHFAELRIDDFDHEANDRARRVELAGGVTHLFEHRFVKMAEGVVSSLLVKWMSLTLLITSRSK